MRRPPQRVAAITLTALAVLSAIAALSGQSQPAAPAPAPAPTLSQVTLRDADDKTGALSVSTAAGAPVALSLDIKTAVPGHADGVLHVTTFSTADQPPIVVAARLFTGAGPAASQTDSVPVKLDTPHLMPVDMTFDRPLPSKAFKGRLSLISGNDLARSWDITVNVGARATMTATPVGVLQFVEVWPWQIVLGNDDSFSFTLSDKDGSATFDNVTARVEPAPAAPAKALTSNFGIGNFTFWRKADVNIAQPLGTGDERVDLERRGSRATGVTIVKQQTFKSAVSGLAPGTYTGTLAFAADEAADEAKLPLTIQVRHHWWMAVIVIAFGSLLGWFTSKWLVAWRKRRQRQRDIAQLRDRANSLSRRDAPRLGWHFPSEEGALGLARTRVMLHQLSVLTKSTQATLLRDDEIQQRQHESEQRIAAFETLRKARLAVQPLADDRPAAQLAIGRLLRAATDLLDGLLFGDAQQTQFNDIITKTTAWTSVATEFANYQAEILRRRNSSGRPTQAQVDAVSPQALQSELKKLLLALPTQETIQAAPTVADLWPYDDAIARLALLWRERGLPWSGSLVTASAGGKLLADQFAIVDTEVWNTLKGGSKELAIKPDGTHIQEPQTFDMVEVYLTTDGVKAGGVPIGAERLKYHPLRVSWCVELLDPYGKVTATRYTETESLSVVQYFPQAGSVRISASLKWEGQDVAVPPNGCLNLTIVDNPDIVDTKFSAEWPEWAAIALAILFTIATALNTQYDATFGSMSQYLGLFVWAAGAATGGNLFSQLGTTSTPGGAAAKT